MNREVKTKIFDSWNEYYEWRSIKLKEDKFRDAGLSDCYGKIKFDYIELF